jgi:hypothetical protein
MAAMSVVYTLYDALVSINVPDDKARAVIDAIEREMMDKLATKADIAHLRETLSQDIRGLALRTATDLAHIKETLSQDIVGAKADARHLGEMLAKDIQGGATKVELAEFGRKLTTQMYLAVGGSAVLTCSVLGTLMAFLR